MKLFLRHLFFWNVPVQDAFFGLTLFFSMTRMQTKVEITKSNGTKLEANTDFECVKDFCERNCPSFYKRDGFHQMFKPLQA